MYPRETNRKRYPTTTADLPRSNYAYIQLAETIEDLKDDVTSLKELIKLLMQQNNDLKLAILEQHVKDHFTIEDFEKYFDISKRLQQQDRTENKLGYLKKKEGAKIVYTKEHIKDYLDSEFEEFKPTRNNPKT